VPAIFRIFIFVAVSAAMFVGAFLYSRKLQRDPDAQDYFDEPVPLAELRTNNPKLTVEAEDSRRALYWVKESSTGHRVPFPMDEAPGARLRFVDCDLKQVPTNVLYPNRTAITCLEVRNDKHFLSAYYFETKDEVRPIVDFFELNVDADSRIPLFHRDHSAQRERRRKFTHEFIVSYMLEPGWGFIGYREEKNPGLPAVN
jgi:hypothetical protein